MSVWKLIRLNFGRNVAHFGEVGIGIEETSERVRSDTLFSAWISAYARLAGAGAVESLLEQFNTSNPPFHLSSTFIYHQFNNVNTYYLPRPRHYPIAYPIGEDWAIAKDFKNFQYLPLSVWRHWYQTEQFSAVELQILTDRNNRFTYKNIFRKYKLPKVSIDRVTNASNLYHTGVVQYRSEANNHSGLYFLAEFSDDSVISVQDFLAVLSFLGGEGLGGERSSGAGRFKVDDNTESDLVQLWKPIINFQGGNAYSLVSVFWTDEETHRDNLVEAARTPRASYDLQERGGWVASPCSDGRQMRRKAVQMFVESSVFPEKPIGKLANVTPDQFRSHTVYRSGISMSLPVTVQEG